MDSQYTYCSPLKPGRGDDAGRQLMRVAMLTGVLAIGLFTTFYRFGWSSYAGASRDLAQVSAGQVSSGDLGTMDDGWPPPPPSFP